MKAVRVLRVAKARLVALVTELCEARGGPAPASDIVAAAQRTPWGKRYQYRALYVMLVRVTGQGLLSRARMPNTARATGARRTLYAWWPGPLDDECLGVPDHENSRALGTLVDRAVATLKTGVVFRPTWVARSIAVARPITTTDEIREALRRRSAVQRSVVVACTAESGWAGWWRVADEDAARVRRHGRSASDALFTRVREARPV